MVGRVHAAYASGNGRFVVTLAGISAADRFHPDALRRRVSAFAGVKQNLIRGRKRPLLVSPQFLAVRPPVAP